MALDTETFALPLTLFEDVAVIVTGPLVATPVTVAVSSCELGSTPPALTVAFPDALDDQLTARPKRTCPLASLDVAVTTVVCPTAMVLAAIETVTDATGAGITT